MIKYETMINGETYIKVSGSSKEIASEVSLMIALIYDEILKKNPAYAAMFRRLITRGSNYAMDTIERGEFHI